MSITRRQLLIGYSTTGAVAPVMPAEQSRRSTPPRAAFVPAAAAAVWSGSATSTTSVWLAPIWPAAAAKASALRSQSATRAPSAARRAATALPAPEAPPVTTAPRPLNLPSVTWVTSRIAPRAHPNGVRPPSTCLSDRRTPAQVIVRWQRHGRVLEEQDLIDFDHSCCGRRFRFGPATAQPRTSQPGSYARQNGR